MVKQPWHVVKQQLRGQPYCWAPAATVVFGAASGDALSLDCLLQQHGIGRHKLALAVQRQLLYYAATVATSVSVVLLLFAAHCAVGGPSGWHASGGQLVAVAMPHACMLALAGSSRSRSRFSWGKLLWLPLWWYPSLAEGLHGSSAL